MAMAVAAAAVSCSAPVQAFSMKRISTRAPRASAYGGGVVRVRCAREEDGSWEARCVSQREVFRSTAIDLDHSIAALETADDKKSGEKEVGAGKLVKLRAFNIFASKVRDTIKDENPVANGHELKRIAGQKWAQLDNGYKQEFIEIAQNENDLIEKLPVDPNAPKRRRRKRIKAEIKLGADSGQLPKRRGKHPENDDGTNGEAGNGILPGTEGQPKRRRMRKQGDTTGKAADPAVSGPVDGSFGSGYLVTVRVGDTDMVFRGVLFEPSIAMPPNKANDLAPGVKLARRNDGIVFPAAGMASSSKHISGGVGPTSGTVSFVK